MKSQDQTIINNSNKRILYLDVLRILATVGVMLIHISSMYLYIVDVNSFEYKVFNIGQSIVRWSVPIFVMISGSLFLARDIDIKRIYKKNILRIITAFIFWSLLYALIDLKNGASIKQFCYAILNGHYHMWFLFMIVGLYLLVPFVKKIVCSKDLMRYFLVLSLIFTFIIPQILNSVIFINEHIGSKIRTVVGHVSFHFTLGYISYFVLGYYLNKIEIPKKFRRVIYALSIVGFAFTIVGSKYISIYANEAQRMLYDNFTINVLLESIGLFVFFKYDVGSIQINEKIKKVILKLSKYSFGAYLVHSLIIEELNNTWGINTMICNPIVSVIMITIIVFVVSFIISFICNHIPFLNKYIV